MSASRSRQRPGRTVTRSFCPLPSRARRRRLRRCGNADLPRPRLTKDISEEYGQRIRCLVDLPGSDTGPGGDLDEKSLSILMPFNPRFRTSMKSEGSPERFHPRFLRVGTALRGIIGPHGNTFLHFPGLFARNILEGAGYKNPQPTPSNIGKLRRGLQVLPPHPV